MEHFSSNTYVLVQVDLFAGQTHAVLLQLDSIGELLADEYTLQPRQTQARQQTKRKYSLSTQGFILILVNVNTRLFPCNRTSIDNTINISPEANNHPLGSTESKSVSEGFVWLGFRLLGRTW